MAPQPTPAELEEFGKKWRAATDGITSNLTYQQSAEKLRELIKTKIVKYTDIRENPAKFFYFHREIVDPLKRGGGFLVRTTVQFNLFAGTILGLGSPSQVAQLDEMQTRGDLGCFLLTEKFAGVNSGLVVGTTATWNQQRRCFIVNSPNTGAEKNWISQGLTAEKCALIASLVVNGKNHGPHGFLMNLRENGKIIKGVTLGDMGLKTTANDLDNAWIAFKDVELPRSALLNRYADIDEKTGNYVQTTKEKMRIEIIGQRLLTGRVAVGQAALEYTAKLFAATKKYTDAKRVWSPSSPDATLSTIPQIAQIYRDYEIAIDRLKTFSRKVEDELSEVLRRDGIPSPELVKRIAVAKIACVENSIALCNRLKQELGSYSLMVGTGFEHIDLLMMCKFAEGDSRILMQKLARDQVGATVSASASPSAAKVSDWKATDARKEIEERVRFLAAVPKDKWNEHFRTVYDLANVVIEDTIDRTLSSSSSSSASKL